jgi:two-component system, NarL family, nitrate/nitrite response regulator NarL
MRCLIVDDNQSFLEAARALLVQEGLTVVGVASTGAVAVRLAETLRPDVVLVDLDLGGESGFELARRLVEDGPRSGPTVILISTHGEVEFADLIASSPAAGFIPKLELSARAVRGIAGGLSP